MITVWLTYKQWQAAYYWAAPRHRQYLDAAVEDAKKRHVTMPYPGWAALVRRLERQVFNRWGERRQLAVDVRGAGSALTAISRELARVAGHPAMRGEIVIGYSADEFIVWGGVKPGTWVPYVVPGQPAFKLSPKFEPNPVATIGPAGVRLREGITYWVPTGPPGDTSEWLGWDSLDEDQATGT